MKTRLLTGMLLLLMAELGCGYSSAHRFVLAETLYRHPGGVTADCPEMEGYRAYAVWRHDDGTFWCEMVPTNTGLWSR